MTDNIVIPEDSILATVKKLLGPGISDTHFDPDIIVHINTAFFTLNELGVGPEVPFSIEDYSAVWSDFIPESNIEAVKTYIYLSTRLVFDPPTSGPLINVIQDKMKELEWRMNEYVDPAE